MPGQTTVTFAQSHHLAPLAATMMGPAPADEIIAISLYLKPHPLPAMHGDKRAAMAAFRATSQAEGIAKVQDFAAAHGLKVIGTDAARRLVRLSGSVSQCQAAFQINLNHYRGVRDRFRAYEGALSLPDDLAPYVESVLGLDQRPVAFRKVLMRPQSQALPGYAPNLVGQFYGFPAVQNGAPVCIAIIELGGGYLDSDTATAFAAMGLAPPSVVAVPVDGGGNQPTPDSGADGEVALDIQVAGGVAPGAKLAVYFTPNTDAGFADAISAASQDSGNDPSVMSISWGGPEDGWSAQARATMNSVLQDAASLDISVFVAAGDNLGTDGLNDGKAHVDFPASSPWAVGCGGTAITVSGGSILREIVWNDGSSGTGGGISDVFAVPAFQAGVQLPPSVNGGKAGRGVPDVAADGSPETGYQIVVNGQTMVVGGTSAVAPLWAGLFALINSMAAKKPGFPLPFLYQNQELFRAITSGSNIPTGSTLGYQAGPGWNACAGLGAPRGAEIFKAFTATS